MRRVALFVLCAAAFGLVGCGSSSDSLAQVMPDKGNGEAPPSSSSDNGGGTGDTSGNTGSGGDADPNAPNAGSFSTSGTVLGQSMSGIGNQTILQLGDDGKPVGVIVTFASKGLSCGFAQSHAATFNATPSERVVTLIVQKTGFAPDTFQVGAMGSDGPNVYMHAGVLDASCQSPTTGDAATDGTSGSVTIKSVSDSLVEGSFDVRFDNGDHVTGTFSSDVCDVSNAAGDDTGTCM
jgi:hypothetical protein